MKTSPFHHQEIASRFHLERFSSADYSEQGTGKTWTAINVIEKRIEAKQINKALIICPASIVHVWENEIEKHSSFLTYTTLKGPGRIYDFYYTNSHCYIISYDSLTSEIVKIAKDKVQQVIFDEVHKVKNIKAKRTTFALALATHIPYRLQMSGTPFPNSFEDVFTLFYILDRGATLGINYWSFLRRYFFEKRTPTRKGFVIRKYIPRPELSYLIRKALKEKAVRFTKEQLKDFPEKIYQVIPVSLTPDQRKYYSRLSKDLPLEEFNFELPPNVLAKYEKLQQITSGFLYLDDGKVVEFENPKLQALLDILPNTTAVKKTVIAVKYRHEIKMLKDTLKSYNPLVIDGSTSNKGKIVELFQRNPNYRVLIMQVGCGIGITLTAADTMIFLSNTFNYADRYQSEDRIHRTGQTSKRTLYIDIVAKDTIDERILEILRTKEQRIKKVVKATAKI